MEKSELGSLLRCMAGDSGHELKRDSGYKLEQGRFWLDIKITFSL